MRKKFLNRGQNVIEYILLVIVVVLILISGILVNHGAFIQSTTRVLSLPSEGLNIVNEKITFVDRDGVNIARSDVIHP
ncbi:MAG: hypothetical protein WCI27_01520 [Candidatus Omnitrophota bacterium]